MNKLFDIACNFTSNRFDEDLDKVIANAIDKNVDKFLLVSAEMSDIDRILDINNLYPDNCYFTSGVHPHHANDFFDESPSILEKSLLQNITQMLLERLVLIFLEIYQAMIIRYMHLKSKLKLPLNTISLFFFIKEILIEIL